MDSEAIKRDLLLREYAEAASAARQHEQLTRTSVSVFIPVLLALLGYVLGATPAMAVKFALSLAGFGISLLAANIVRRHQLYYLSYIERARTVESLLRVNGEQVLWLYTQGARATEVSRTVSNKDAFLALFFLAALSFGAIAVRVSLSWFGV